MTANLSRMEIGVIIAGMNTTVNIVDSGDLPVCPYCGKEIKNILKQEIGSINVHVIYFCEHCKKILSIVSEKYGF